MSWLKLKQSRPIIGGRKDDACINGAPPSPLRPMIYTSRQKVGLWALGFMGLICGPLCVILFFTGLYRPIGRYVLNDATLGISAELQNWWSGGNYNVVLACGANGTTSRQITVSGLNIDLAADFAVAQSPDCVATFAYRLCGRRSELGCNNQDRKTFLTTPKA
jgi:hypothetical protein